MAWRDGDGLEKSSPCLSVLAFCKAFDDERVVLACVAELAVVGVFPPLDMDDVIVWELLRGDALRQIDRTPDARNANVFLDAYDEFVCLRL